MNTVADLRETFGPNCLRRPVFLAHPAYAEDGDGLRYLRQLQDAGVEVRVMTQVGGPSVPLDEWLAAAPEQE